MSKEKNKSTKVHNDGPKRAGPKSGAGWRPKSKGQAALPQDNDYLGRLILDTNNAEMAVVDITLKIENLRSFLRAWAINDLPTKSACAFITMMMGRTPAEELPVYELESFINKLEGLNSLIKALEYNKRKASS